MPRPSHRWPLAFCLIAIASTALSTLPPTDPATAYLALCAAVKDSPAAIREWVDYHAALGVGKFYLMTTDDPNSSKIAESLASYLTTGVVDFFELPRVNPRTIPLLQVRLYAACLNATRDSHTFIGFWDVDEFLVWTPPLDEKERKLSFPAFLRKFEGAGGLAVPWRVVGPSGHTKPPRLGLHTLAAYQRCTPWSYRDNSEIKTIANTRYAVRPRSDPHTFDYSHEKTAVNAAGEAVEGSRDPSVAAAWAARQEAPPVALYHYVTRSEAEYREKMRRGSAMGNRKGWEYFKGVEAAAGVRCGEAAAACAAMGLPGCEADDIDVAR